MTKSVRGVSLLAALALTLTACGGGGSGHDTKSAASRLPGASDSSGAAPAPGSTGSTAAAAADASAAPAAGAAAASTGGSSTGGSATASGAPAAVKASGGSSGGGGASSAAASGSTPAARNAASSTPAGGGSAPAGKSSAAPAPAPTPGAPGTGAPGAGDKTGVTSGDVLFGIHMPLSGPVGVLVGNGWKGTDAYFKSVNDAGGVNGRKLKLVVSDDKYSAQGAAAAIRDLVDSKHVFAVACPVGVDQCSVAVDYANSKGVPYLSGGFREKYLEDKPWAFPVTASYPYGGNRLLDYMFQKRGYTSKRKIGLFWLHSENLDEMGGAADLELAKLGGGKFAVKYPAEKDQSDFSAAVTKFQSAGVDTVWLHVAPDLSTKFAAQAKLLGYQPQYVFTLPVGGDIWAAAAGGNLDKAFGLAGFADPQWSGTAKFQEAFHKYYPDEQADEFNLLCYAIGVVYAEGLKEAGADLGRDSFARAMNKVDIDTGISQPISYTQRGRIGGPNSKFAVWEIHGAKTDQMTGFDW
jgi:branched-chain amino acid transport system substrate-binding protein